MILKKTVCTICRKEFHRPASKIGRGKKDYCSRDCYKIASRKGSNRECSNPVCPEKFWCWPCRAKKKEVFCSRSCSIAWRRNYWRKITKEGMNDCWEWTGWKDRQGYGKFKIYGRSPEGVHRLVYRELVGDIPKGKQLDHLCRNTSCVNPNHLEAVTCRENILRGNGLASKNAKKTHCLRGHEFTAENTEWKTPTKRRCITCRNKQNRDRRRRNRQYG